MTLQDISTLALYIVGGLVALGGAIVYWTNEKKKQRQEEDSVEERIKKLFKEEIQLLNNKVERLTDVANVQSAEIQELKKTQLELQKANDLLTKIFQGRDDESVEYRKAGREAMQRVAELAPVIIETNGNTKEILKNLDRLFVSINKHLEILENQEKIVTTEKVVTTEHKKK